MRVALYALLLCAICLLGVACQRDDMWDQPRSKVLGPSDFFDDGQAARMPVAGTVARGNLQEDDLLYRGIENGAPARRFPFEITKEVLLRGRERYDIFCLPCHAQSGDGLGMIVQRGFKQPASFHEERLRKALPGYYYMILTMGSKTMTDGVAAYGGKGDKVHPPIAKGMPPSDRWAIIAYIRALQESQWAPVDELPPDARNKVLESDVKTTTDGKD